MGRASMAGWVGEGPRPASPPRGAAQAQLKGAAEMHDAGGWRRGAAAPPRQRQRHFHLWDGYFCQLDGS